MKPSSSISPAASSSRAFHTIVPDPVRSPRCQPLSIGPTDSAIAGMLTVAAAISAAGVVLSHPVVSRSEEHTSELQSLMRISYAVFCLKKKNQKKTQEGKSYKSE